MSNHTFLITGASRGIGLAAANQLSHQGHQVVGLARNIEIPDFPGTLLACDLSRQDDTERVLEAIKAEYEIDGIVNNAGIASPQSLEEVDFDTLRHVFELNVRAAVQLTQSLVEPMKQRQFGRIVNICSRAIYGSKNRTAYSAAKNALVACSKTWALELAEYGITSNAVAPGPIETELFRKSRPKGSAEEQAALATIPMRRIGTPDEVASAVCFLLQDDAAFITGQVLGVDGGGSLRSNQ